MAICQNFSVGRTNLHKKGFLHKLPNEQVPNTFEFDFLDRSTAEKSSAKKIPQTSPIQWNKQSMLESNIVTGYVCPRNHLKNFRIEFRAHEFNRRLRHIEPLNFAVEFIQ